MKQSCATLFGLPNSPEAYELRDFLKRSGFQFEWIDLKTDDGAHGNDSSPLADPRDSRARETSSRSALQMS